MAEELIAQHKWRKRLSEWSPLCDNVMRLDRSESLVESAMKLNSLGICAPPCEMCVTPFGELEALEKPCAWPRVPAKWSVQLNGQFVGLQPWSACAASMGSSFDGRYVGSNVMPNGRKICWWSSQQTMPGVIFGNNIIEPNGPACKVAANVKSHTIYVDGTEQNKVLRLSFGAAVYGRSIFFPFIVSLSVEVHYRLNIGGAAPFGTFTLPFDRLAYATVPDPDGGADAQIPTAQVITWPGSVTATSNPAADPGPGA